MVFLHGQAARDEYVYLTQALGAQTDAVLQEAEQYAKRTFKR